MQPAVSSACLFPMLTEDAFQTLCETGIRSVEVFLNAPSEATNAFAKKIRSIQQQYDVRIPAIHPWTAPNEYFMLFSRYQRRYEDFVEQAKQIFSLMNEVGAEIYILHGALKGKIPDVSFYCERYKQLYDLGKEYGITVTHENVNKYVGSDLSFLQEMCNQLGEDAKFTFDTKQAIRSDMHIDAALQAVGTHIAHVHLSDHGTAGDCLRIGQGDFDISAFLTKLRDFGYQGTVTLELYREAFSSPAELAEDYHKIENILQNI